LMAGTRFALCPPYDLKLLVPVNPLAPPVFYV
jgi:hypothetical protein